MKPIDLEEPTFGRYFDELPLWSSAFGLFLLEQVPLAPGLRILDIGCGTGFLSIELAQRCGPGTTVVAVDPWHAATQRLREKVEYFGFDNVEVVEGDAAVYAGDTESFDLLVCNLGINNFDDPAAVLTNAFRLAKPGASLALTTNVIGHMQEFYEVFAATLIECGLSAALRALGEHVAHRGDLGSVRSLVEDAGFEVRRTRERKFPLRFASGSAFLGHTLIRVGFLPAWHELVPAEEQRFWSQLEERLDRRAAQHGDLSLTIPMLYLEAVKPVDPGVP